MVACDRCYREFATYAALKRHYGEKHSKLKWPQIFENKLIEESNLQGYRVNPHPTRSSHAKLIIAVIMIVIVIGGVLSLAIIWLPGGITQPSAIPSNPNSTLKPSGFNAAIIDQVGADLPDVAFVRNAEQTLTSSGFNVTYYPAADATVDFYKRLPSFGYRVIVWRVHSATWINNGIVPFTSEPYDANKYSMEQLTGDLIEVTPSLTGPATGPYYFGISILFVAEEMEGNFGGAIIILSSCNGLHDHIFADALIRRGASAVISWDKLVTINHTDMATEVLLKALVQGSTVSQAVQVAMDQVGPDPEYGSILRYYPVESAQVTLSLALAQTNQITFSTRPVELVQPNHLT